MKHDAQCVVFVIIIISSTVLVGPWPLCCAVYTMSEQYNTSITCANR